MQNNWCDLLPDSHLRMTIRSATQTVKHFRLKIMHISTSIWQNTWEGSPVVILHFSYNTLCHLHSAINKKNYLLVVGCLKIFGTPRTSPVWHRWCLVCNGVYCHQWTHIFEDQDGKAIIVMSHSYTHKNGTSLIQKVENLLK